MKKIIFPLILLTFSYCSTNKIAQDSKKSETTSVETACPDNGKCSFEILQNKSLLVKTDEILPLEQNHSVASILLNYMDLNKNELLNNISYVNLMLVLNLFLNISRLDISKILKLLENSIQKISYQNLLNLY